MRAGCDGGVGKRKEASRCRAFVVIRRVVSRHVCCVDGQNDQARTDLGLVRSCRVLAVALSFLRLSRFVSFVCSFMAPSIAHHRSFPSPRSLARTPCRTLIRGWKERPARVSLPVRSSILHTSTIHARTTTTAQTGARTPHQTGRRAAVGKRAVCRC